MSRSVWWLEHAWLGHGYRDISDSDISHNVVVIEVDGRFGSVDVDAPTVPDGAVVLRGLTVPGFANAHSHAFHRALRGRTQQPGGGTGTFWTWRDVMYSVADRLDPDAYFALAAAVFGEMALAGISCVGEFHYLHHGPGGVSYNNANAMSDAVIAAAGEAGIRITLLDTLYRQGGMSETGENLSPNRVQQRFCDASVDAWASRVASIAVPAHAIVGHAVHSVRAVSVEELRAVGQLGLVGPVHAHVSEQVAENVASIAAHGSTPLRVLDDAGLINDRFTAVHATHVTDTDVAAFGARNAWCCMCPTTERDLADGVGRARDFADAGAGLTLGSDSHAAIDLFEEARLMEHHERLVRQRRGVFSPAELMRAATANGHASLGWHDAGTITFGARADLVTISIDSVQLAGANAESLLASAVFGASARDITNVIADGRVIVRDGRHVSLTVASALHDAISAVVGER